VVDSALAEHTAVHGTGFDAYDEKAIHAVVWDGSTNTNLGTGASTVAAGAFSFEWPFVVDTSHYVFAYIYADENGDGACQPSEHTWSVILYNPIRNITPNTANTGDCTHF
jgi:hypothetical protein